MTSERKAIDQEKLSEFDTNTLEQRGLQNQVASSGLSGQKFLEPVPHFDSVTSEVVYSNSNNAWIVLGRDRPGGSESGYGGSGNTQAGSVDIVVGRMASVEGGPNANVTVAPNFFTDAARIYVSQKTDVDTNFGLVGDAQLTARSAIGLKADGIRVIGREGIKLVTGKAQNIGGAGSGGEKNSQGGKVETVAGIELIAGNDVEGAGLEPIVKAYALNEALLEIVDSIQKLTDIVNENAKMQSQINNALAQHTHEVPQIPVGMTKSAPPIDAGIKIAVKESSKMSSVHQNLYKQKMNTGTALVETRLTPGGKKWFGSRWNKTN